MFGVDAKEVFYQQIYNVLMVLFTLHLVSVTCSYVIKWIRPYLKSNSIISKKHKSISPLDEVSYETSSENIKQRRTSICCDCKDEVFDDDCINLIDNLDALISNTDKSEKYILDPLIKINKITDSELDRVLNLGRVLRNKIKKSNCSNEVQTTISIDPKAHLDYSCSELLLCNLFSENSIKKCESSESFLSASSSKPDLENKVIDKEMEQLITEIVLNQELINQNLSEEKFEIEFGKGISNNIPLIQTDRLSFLKQSQGRPVVQVNKLLETAITEFEKELKPIKDQIKILKECLNGFDSRSKPFIRSPSEISSSLSGSMGYSECFSGTLSTTCSSDMQSFMSSSYHVISEKTFGQFKPDSRFKNIKILDEIVSADSGNNNYRRNHQSSRRPMPFANVTKECDKLSDIRSSLDMNKIKKRSPLAEMYVKLSQCNSQSSFKGKNRKEKVTHSDNTVTYRIDLNVNLAGVPTVSFQNHKPLQDRKMQPLTSQPEDIFSKATNSFTGLSH